MNHIVSLIDSDPRRNCDIRNNSFVYRHPQVPSRCMTVEHNEGFPALRFTKLTPKFREKWGHRLKKEDYFDDVSDIFVLKEVISDFYTLERVDPVDGAPPFEEMLKLYSGIVERQAHRFKRQDRHYELNVDDLISVGMLKLHEEWLYNGHKPKPEFERILSTSIWNKFNSLLGKHYQAQQRKAEEEVSLTDDVNESSFVLADAGFESSFDRDLLEEKIQDLTEPEKVVVREILSPSVGVRAKLSLDNLRYLHVRSQGHKRIMRPSPDIKAASGHSGLSPEELEKAKFSVLKKFNLSTC